MLAPLFSKAWLMACFSAKLKPSAGKVSKAEPPPEMRHSTKSSWVSPWVKDKISSAADNPAASGTGCDASTIFKRSGTPSGLAGVCPYRVTTMPDKGASTGHKASTAWAMAPAALPAPNTRVRPLGGLGKKAGVLWSGSAR